MILPGGDRKILSLGSDPLAWTHSGMSRLGDPGQVRGQQDTDVVKLGLGRVWLTDNLQSCGGQWQTDWEEGSLLGCTTTVPTGLKGRVRGSSGFCKPQGSPQGGAR